MSAWCMCNLVGNALLQLIQVYLYIGLDKSGYQVYIFLISPRKHMLWYSLEAPLMEKKEEYQYFWILLD